jgi:hypothetical protein
MDLDGRVSRFQAPIPALNWADPGLSSSLSQPTGVVSASQGPPPSHPHGSGSRFTACRNITWEAVIYSTWGSWTPSMTRHGGFNAHIVATVARHVHDHLISHQDPIKYTSRQARLDFHPKAQRASIKNVEIQIQPGVFLEHRSNPTRTAEGQVYSFHSTTETITVLPITSYIPGCHYILLEPACTAPSTARSQRDSASHFVEADAGDILSGTQALAAVALGTKTVFKVEFLAGPGYTLCRFLAARSNPV